MLKLLGSDMKLGRITKRDVYVSSSGSTQQQQQHSIMIQCTLYTSMIRTLDRIVYCTVVLYYRIGATSASEPWNLFLDQS